MIHSQRSTRLTGLGESGVDVFKIMKIAGHSSITVSEKYVHPSKESMERAFVRLWEFNKKANKQLPAAVSATVVNSDTQHELPFSKQTLQNQQNKECAPVAQVDRATVS